MLTLYHHPFSPSSRFIRLVLSEYGAAFEERHVEPWDRPQELLVLNAAGTVPVLVENDGPAICGPGPIMEYLDETRGYALTDRRLMPDHPEARAETRRLVEWSLVKFDQEVVGHLVRERIYKQIMPKSPVAANRIPRRCALRGPTSIIISNTSVTWLPPAAGWRAIACPSQISRSRQACPVPTIWVKFPGQTRLMSKAGMPG